MLVANAQALCQWLIHQHRYYASG